ncbi:unnamed protein product [Parnassius mnemosyne]|uniref:Uncharacterized protein n=1 Tax=Parnassius mnemosyne TaxID=213953 RepID=A0AAV1KFC0_9NEOP
MFFFYRIFGCLALVLVFACLVLTIATTLSIGIGIGYNYCFVDYKASKKHVTAYYKYVTRTRTYYYTVKSYVTQPALRNEQGGEVERVQDPLRAVIPLQKIATEESTEARVADEVSTDSITGETLNTSEETETNTRADSTTTEESPTRTIIPISGLDLLSFLSKLRSQNKNYTLQIVN